MAHESRPPQREGDEANPKNAIEAEGFGQNPQELEEIRQALAREADAEKTTPPTPPQTIPEREPVRARIERPLLAELVRRTIRELSRSGDALPTEQEVEADISRMLHNRPLRPQEQRVIRELLTEAERTSPSATSPEDTQGTPRKEMPFRTRLPAEKQQELEGLYRQRLFRTEDPKLVRALMLAYKAGQEANDTAFRDILQGIGSAEIGNLALAFQAGEATSGQYRTAEQQYVTLLMQSTGTETRQLMEANKAGRAADYSALETLLEKAEDAYHVYMAFQAGEESAGGSSDAEKSKVQTAEPQARRSSETQRVVSNNTPETKAVPADEVQVEASETPRFQLQPPQLQPLWDRAPNKENPYARTALHNAYDDGHAGDIERNKSYIWVNSSVLTDEEKLLADEAFRIGYARWEAEHPEEAAERRQQQAARGVTESAESRSETLTPRERLTRLQAESPDIHPDVLDRAFRRGTVWNPNALRNFFKEFGDYFDADQKSKIIEAYNLGAEMEGFPPFPPEPSSEATEEPPDSAEREEEEPAAQERRTQEPTEEERQEEQKRQEEDERRAEEERERQRAEDEEAFDFLDKKLKRVLFGNLDYARRAYAEAELRVDKIQGDTTAEIMEAERMRSAYRGAINAIRDYYQRYIATDTAFSPEQKAQKIHEIVLETTAREANRLFNLKTDIKIKEREEAAEQRIQNIETKSFLGEALFANVEAAKAVGRLALRTAEAYRNLPIKYKLLLSGALAGGSITAGVLALPTLAIGLGLGVSAQRILGGGAAAIGVEAWRRKAQEKKSEKEVAREIERQGDLLTALLATDNQERLNDLMFEQAGRKGWERNKRMALAGITFAAIATGLPGIGIRTGASYLVQSETAHTVMNYLGITDDLKDRVWASADGIKKSIKGFFVQEGVAYAAETQSGGASAPAPVAKGLGSRILQGLASVVGADNPEELSRPTSSASTAAENAPDKQKLRPDAGTQQAPTETKPDTTPNQPPPQQTQPTQLKGREKWDPAQQKWVSVGTTTPEHIPAPPAEGAETAPPRAATAEAPPKTQVAAEKLPPQGVRAETGVPKNAAEVAARARAIEMTTVRKGEGAWQAVRRQFYDRMRTEPQKFGMMPEDAAKLPEDIDKLGKGTKAAKLLNRETLATLKKAGWINTDGTTKLGITKPGVRVFLTPDNSIELQGEGKLKYEMEGQRPKAGVAPERTGRPRGGAAESSGRARAKGAFPQERGTVRQSFDLNKEPSLPELKARLEDTTHTPKAMEAANLKSHLKDFGLKPQEFKNIADMKVKTLIDEMDRHAREIREYGGSTPRENIQIFINKGLFTTRGFSADIAEAQKYLDLSERLEKHMKFFNKATRQNMLNESVKNFLSRTFLPFEK